MASVLPYPWYQWYPRDPNESKSVHLGIETHGDLRNSPLDRPSLGPPCRRFPVSPVLPGRVSATRSQSQRWTVAWRFFLLDSQGVGLKDEDFYSPQCMVNLGENDGTWSWTRFRDIPLWKKNTSAVIEESEHWSLNEGSMIERISDLDCLFNGLISVCLRQMLSIPKGNLRWCESLAAERELHSEVATCHTVSGWI